MHADDYQVQAMRTRGDDPPDARLVNAVLGLTGEAGEVADMLKKHLFHGHPLDQNKLKKEFGDILWYIVQGADSQGWSLAEIMEENIAKLKKRYKDGFSYEASINRVE